MRQGALVDVSDVTGMDTQIIAAPGEIRTPDSWFAGDSRSDRLFQNQLLAALAILKSSFAKAQSCHTQLMSDTIGPEAGRRPPTWQVVR